MGFLQGVAFKSKYGFLSEKVLTGLEIGLGYQPDIVNSIDNDMAKEDFKEMYGCLDCAFKGGPKVPCLEWVAPIVKVEALEIGLGDEVLIVDHGYGAQLNGMLGGAVFWPFGIPPCDEKGDSSFFAIGAEGYLKGGYDTFSEAPLVGGEAGLKFSIHLSEKYVLPLIILGVDFAYTYDGESDLQLGGSVGIVHDLL